MSNVDDVLDNWEELDDIGLSNTLEKLQAERISKPPTEENIKISTKTAIDNNFYPSAILTGSVTTLSYTPTAMKLLQRTPNSESKLSNSNSSTAVESTPLDSMATSFEPVMMLLHKSGDDYDSGNYTQPVNNQTVKILRRPTQNSDIRNDGIKPRQPIKTLQQREQEYAEARLRILGVAKNPEDDAARANAAAEAANAAAINNPKPAAPAMTTPPATISSAYAPIVTHPFIPKVNTTTKITQSGPNLYNNYYYSPPMHTQQQQQQQQQFYYHQSQLATPPAYNNRSPNMLQSSITLPLIYQSQLHQSPQPTAMTWSPVVGGSVSSGAVRQQHHDSILRTPRGPDSGPGFQMRR